MDGRALHEWRGAAVETWRARWGVPELHILATVGSTNDVARALALSGAPEGTTVLADEQTRGRGRRGRTWHAEAGRSLILSMVTRPRCQGAESVLSLRLGLATARAIEAVMALAVGIKWPNDLIIDGRKVGGMLCEGVVEAGRTAFVVAGTGVNVREPAGDWPAELAGRATSLAERAGSAPDVDALAGRVIGEWLAALGGTPDRLSSAELEAFGRRDVLRGRVVTVEGDASGTVVGLDPDGALRVVRDGITGRIVAGTVRPLETTEEGERS